MSDPAARSRPCGVARRRRVELISPGVDPVGAGHDGVSEPTHPVELARQLAKDASRPGLARLRRLYVNPHGHIVAADQNTRLMGKNLGTWMRLRDRYCRIPWCGAPIRHVDHIRPHAEGGRHQRRER